MSRDRKPQTATGAVEHGPYSLVMSLMTGALIIQRQGPAKKSTVAFVDSLAQWDRFVAALEDGANEVAAVHAIDA
jgi:hypothetical protein